MNPKSDYSFCSITSSSKGIWVQIPNIWDKIPNIVTKKTSSKVC